MAMLNNQMVEVSKSRHGSQSTQATLFSVLGDGFFALYLRRNSVSIA